MALLGREIDDSDDELEEDEFDWDYDQDLDDDHEAPDGDDEVDASTALEGYNGLDEANATNSNGHEQDQHELVHPSWDPDVDDIYGSGDPVVGTGSPPTDGSGRAGAGHATPALPPPSQSIPIDNSATDPGSADGSGSSFDVAEFSRRYLPQSPLARDSAGHGTNGLVPPNFQDSRHNLPDRGALQPASAQAQSPEEGARSDNPEPVPVPAPQPLVPSASQALSPDQQDTQTERRRRARAALASYQHSAEEERDRRARHSAEEDARRDMLQVKYAMARERLNEAMQGPSQRSLLDGRQVRGNWGLGGASGSARNEQTLSVQMQLSRALATHLAVLRHEHGQTENDQAEGSHTEGTNPGRSPFEHAADVDDDDVDDPPRDDRHDDL
ncbi:unnamed protein product [Discula destructiva]